LGDVHLVQARCARLGAQYLQQRPAEVGGERLGAGPGLLGEDRGGVEQVAGHLRPLRAVAGEDEGDLAGGRGGALDHGVRGFAVGERREPGPQLVPVTADDHGPLLQLRPRGEEAATDVGQGEPFGAVEVVQQPAGLLAQGPGGLRGQRPREHVQGPGGGRVLRCGGLLAVGGGRGPRGLLDDGVHVGAAHPERGDGRTPWPVPVGPGGLLGEQAHVPVGPVDVLGRLVDVQRPRQDSVADGHHHLDDASDARGRLRVADVGLQRAQPQRPVRTAPVAVRGEQRLRLDRVAEPGSGAVGLHGVHFVRGEPGIGQRLPDDLPLGPAAGRGQAVGGAVLVDGAAPHDGEDLVPVAHGVGQPLDQDQAHALGEAGSVGRRGERLAAAVGGQRALPARHRERGRSGHHHHAAGQCHGALAAPQRLYGEVESGQ
jgi:hypothetical protein